MIRVERFIAGRVSAVVKWESSKTADHKKDMVLGVFMAQKSTDMEKPKPSERSAIEEVDPDGKANWGIPVAADRVTSMLQPAISTFGLPTNPPSSSCQQMKYCAQKA